jgi:hypothetical protein
MTTQSPQVEKILHKIADNLCECIIAYGNRHRFLHSFFVQSLVMLVVPLAVLAYGMYKDIDVFLLCSSMGWLCLLLLGLVKLLPKIFPLVTFETKYRLKLNRIPLLAKFSLLSVVVACYVALVLLNMPRANTSGTIMLANLFGLF